jgi:betaine-aldehyde dehydrogenase
VLATEMPHGGFASSGFGSDLSAYSLRDYTRLKHVVTRLG